MGLAWPPPGLITTFEGYTIETSNNEGAVFLTVRWRDRMIVKLTLEADASYALRAQLWRHSAMIGELGQLIEQQRQLGAMNENNNARGNQEPENRTT